jgi:energy-coupling factor transport system permease protein
LPVGCLKYYVLVSTLFVTGAAVLGIKKTAKPLKAILPLVVLIMLLTTLFYKEGESYFTLFNFPVLTRGGIYQAGLLIGRFTGITLLFAIFLMTTRMENFTLALRFFGLPYKVAVVITLMVRYLPYAASLYETTIDAHKMRLTNNSKIISKWNFPARFNRLLSVLVSVLIQAIKTIPDIAMALEVRGVGRKNKPGNIKKMKGLKNLSGELILSFLIISIILCYLFL